MRRERRHSHENHERWLVSYADFITLLFAFFVVMFASSQTDKSRAKQISEAVEKALENGKSVGVPPSVAKILGGTVDDKGQAVDVTLASGYAPVARGQRAPATRMCRMGHHDLWHLPKLSLSPASPVQLWRPI